MTVQVLSVSVGRVNLVSRYGKNEVKPHDEDTLLVKIRVGTDSPNKKVNYVPWSGFADASYKDNFNNSYRKQQFTGNDIEGAAAYGVITRGKHIEDLVVFEKPLETTTQVKLKLKGEYLGLKSDYHFKIDRSAWVKR